MHPTLNRRVLLGTGASLALLPALCVRRAHAQAETIRVGALTDLSGPYRDIEGPTGTICAQQAIAEFTEANLTWPRRSGPPGMRARRA